MRRLLIPISLFGALAASHVAASHTATTTAVPPVGGRIDRMMSPQQRSASIAAIKAETANLPGVDTVADNQALVQFMAARPEFMDAGTSDSGFTAWGRWLDGVQYLIVRNRPPDARQSASQSSAQVTPVILHVASGGPIAGLARRLDDVLLAQDSGTASSSPEDGKPSNLPKSNQYRVLSSMGPGFLDVRPAIRNYLYNAGYQEVQADATVQGLRTVGGDGVFYIDAHGGSSTGSYALWTATERTDANDELFKEDLDAGRLVIMNACDDASVPDNDPNANTSDLCDSRVHPERFKNHYAMTSLFISQYWNNFSDYSMVYIDGCNFDRTTSADFIAALVSKHANVIFGWNGEVADDDGANTARYIFDRLTGANDFRPQKRTTGFNQRPFDWISVLADCSANTPYCKSGSANLTATEGIPGCAVPTGGFCDATFGLLAPSIRRMWVYESPNLSLMPSDLLFITGLFGLDPGGADQSSDSGARGVTIGGTEVSVLLWTPTAIVVNLPHAGAGAAGDVVVRNGDRFSNVAQLTEWTAPFTFALNDFQSLAEKVTINAHFRADIRKTVATIGAPPVEPTGELPDLPTGFPLFLPPGLSWNTLIDDTGGQDACTGAATTTAANGQTTTEVWNGTKTVSYKNDGQGAEAASSYVHVMDSTTIVLTLVDWRGTCNAIIDGTPSTVGGLHPGEVSPASDGSQDGTVAFLLDSTATITANQIPQIPKTTYSHSALGGGSTAKATWSWPATAPTTGAPDPDSPR